MIIEDPSTNLRLKADARGYNPDFPTADFKVPLVDSSGRAMLSNVSGAKAPIPVFGTVHGQSIRFYPKRVYNEKKSELNMSEDFDTVDMCEISNPSDKFCVVHKRVIELDSWQLKAWGHIYQAYKEQKQLGGTLVTDWEAINENQRALLINFGIKTVEQMDALTPDAMAKLGNEGPELKEKAGRHMKGKADELKAEDYKKEVDTLRKELERLSAESEAKLEAKFKMWQTQALKEAKPVVHRRKRGPNKARVLPVPVPPTEIVA